MCYGIEHNVLKRKVSRPKQHLRKRLIFITTKKTQPKTALRCFDRLLLSIKQMTIKAGFYM